MFSKRDFWNLLGGVPAVQAMLTATAASRMSAAGTDAEASVSPT